MLLFNGLGETSTHLADIFQEIVACKQETVLELSNTSFLLIIIGVTVIALPILILISSSYFVQNRLNLLWNQISSFSNDEKSDLKQICIDRLEKVHNEISLHELFAHISASTERKKFNYVKKYIMILMILPLIGAIYYLVSNYSYYLYFAQALKNRPELLSLLITSNVNLSKLDTWAGQNWGSFIGYDFQAYYPGYIPVSTDYAKNLQYITESLLNDTQSIVSPTYQELLGNDIYQLFVNTTPSELYVLKYGYKFAIHYLILEALFIGYSETLDILDQYMVFYGNLRLIGIEYSNVFQQILLYSKNTIQSTLIDFIIFSTFFCFLFYLVYILCFYPFLAREQKKVLAIAEFSKILILNSRPIDFKSSRTLSKLDD